MREFQIRCEIFDRSEFSGAIKGDEKKSYILCLC